MRTQHPAKKEPILIIVSVVPLLIPSGMAILSSFNSIGGFLSPTIINSITMKMSGTATNAMLVGGVLSVATSVVVAITNFQGKALNAPEENAVH